MLFSRHIMALPYHATLSRDGLICYMDLSDHVPGVTFTYCDLSTWEAFSRQKLFQTQFFNNKFCMLIEISQDCFPKGPTDKESALFM